MVLRLFRPRHQLVPTFRLRILRILDFQPTDAVALVDAQLALRHNPFQIVVANFFKQKAIATIVLGYGYYEQLYRLAAQQKFGIFCAAAMACSR